jgi:hypothetical protein
MPSRAEVIETTVSNVGAELARRGLDPDDRVTITIEPDELIPGRRASRARVIAAGLIDDGIDRLIKQAQREVERVPDEDRSRYERSRQRGAQTKTRSSRRQPSCRASEARVPARGIHRVVNTTMANGSGSSRYGAAPV